MFSMLKRWFVLLGVGFLTACQPSQSGLENGFATNLFPTSFDWLLVGAAVVLLF